YDAVCLIFEQCLAQLKKIDSLKLCVLGFSRVQKTMGIHFHFAPRGPVGSRRRHVEITFSRRTRLSRVLILGLPSQVEEGERAWGIERARRGGSGEKGRSTRFLNEFLHFMLAKHFHLKLALSRVEFYEKM
ncbi:hypothetical protein PENTCL1PPCAC_8216, partial [Pristionchus entomophagus]